MKFKARNKNICTTKFFLNNLLILKVTNKIKPYLGLLLSHIVEDWTRLNGEMTVILSPQVSAGVAPFYWALALLYWR